MKIPTLSRMLALVSEAKKATISLIGLAALLIATGALTGNVLHIAQGLVTLGTVLGVYKAANAAPAPVVAPDVPAVPPAAPEAPADPAAAA